MRPLTVLAMLFLMLHVNVSSFAETPNNNNIIINDVKDVKNSVHILRVKVLSDWYLQSIETLLQQAGVAYDVIPEDSDKLQTARGTLLIPLTNTSSPLQLGLVDKFIHQNKGRVLLFPAHHSLDPQASFPVLQWMDITLTGSLALTQTIQIKWPNTTGSLASGSESLEPGQEMVMPVAGKTAKTTLFFTPASGEKSALALPAIIQTPVGYFFNWRWGAELSPETNINALTLALSSQHALTNEASEKPPVVSNNSNKPAAVEAIPVAEAALPKAFSEREEFREPPLPDSAAPVPDSADPWIVENQLTPSGLDLATYNKNIKTLDTYKRWVTDAIDSSLQLSLGMPVKEAQQLLVESRIETAQFESAFLNGELNKGISAFDQAKQLLQKAVILTSPSYRIEGRGLWLDRSSIVATGGPEGLRNLLRKLQQSGINLVYFETVNAGFPIYPSKLLPQNPLITGWDPLAVAVEEGHKLGMEVHAWVWTFAVGNIKHNRVIGQPDSYPGPILKDRDLMSEAIRSASGRLVPDGQDEYWLSPASPKARAFLKELFSEIVRTYKVDGLQLDYIRYPFQRSYSQVGYESVGQARFREDTGLSPNSGEGVLKTWIAWKAYQVNTFVKEVSSTLKAINPNLKLSGAVFPMSRTQRLFAIQQDWETWADNGWIDTLSPMTYTASKKEFKRLINYVTHASKQKILIYPGIALFKLDPTDLLGHLEIIRENGGMGSTMFAMAHLDDDKLRALKQGPYKVKPASAPHHEPLTGLAQLTDEFQHQLNLMILQGEMTQMKPSDIQVLQQTAQGLSTQIQSLSMQTQSIEAMRALQNQFWVLNQKTLDWLKREDATHPFRVQYFKQYLERLNRMLNYTLTSIAMRDLRENSRSTDSLTTPTPITPAPNTPATAPESNTAAVK
ncbi:MAG: family 10 glycosylhydrolase [Cyanobacteria bacterium]|nr:family 10 glycosylhydrolase [Cyanobacteriota bacterium]